MLRLEAVQAARLHAFVSLGRGLRVIRSSSFHRKFGARLVCTAAVQVEGRSYLRLRQASAASGDGHKRIAIGSHPTGLTIKLCLARHIPNLLSPVVQSLEVATVSNMRALNRLLAQVRRGSVFRVALC